MELNASTSRLPNVGGMCSNGGAQAIQGVQYISPIASPRQALQTTMMPTVAPNPQPSTSQQAMVYSSPVQPMACYQGYPNMQPMQYSPQVQYPQQIMHQPYVHQQPTFTPAAGPVYMQQPYQAGNQVMLHQQQHVAGPVYMQQPYQAGTQFITHQQQFHQNHAGPVYMQQPYQAGNQVIMHQQPHHQHSGHINPHMSATDRKVDDSRPPLPMEGAVHMLICGIDYACDSQSWAGPPPHGHGPLDTHYAFEMMKDLAFKSGAQYLTLWNQECTKERVVQAVQEVASKCGPNDTFIFYYTGHGDRLPRADSRDGGQDESLCLVDANGNTDDPSMQLRNHVWLRDDDLANAMIGATSNKPKVLVLVDACHSGTICDFDQESQWAKDKRRAISMTGCEDSETSAGTGKGGMFTIALTKAIQELQGHGSFNVSAVYNKTLDFYLAAKKPGHTQSIAIHGCETLPNEMAWPLQPKGQYASPANQIWRGMRGLVGLN